MANPKIEKLVAEKAAHVARLNELHRQRTNQMDELKKTKDEILAQSGAIIALDRAIAIVREPDAPPADVPAAAKPE